MKYQSIREEELKNKIAQDWFWLFDRTKIAGNTKLCVCPHNLHHCDIYIHCVATKIRNNSTWKYSHNAIQSLLWTEAKIGAVYFYKSFKQNILKIGKVAFSISICPLPC